MSHLFRYQSALVRRVLLTGLFLIAVLLPAFAAHAEDGVVHAVLFYSPSCTHCHEVMEQHLPPLVEKYGAQLDVIGVDVEHEVGQNLYQAMLAAFSVPDERVGVPTLVVGSMVLVGSVEIPEQLPEIIEEGLASGGIGWPAIPGLETVLASQANAPSAPAAPQPQSDQPLYLLRFMEDPLANSVAVLILLLMIGMVVFVLARFLGGKSVPALPKWVFPVLVVVGVGVAIYMSYIELTGSEAVCGPVGNCNKVQESPYATLLGFLPVGVLGLMGYGMMLIAWATRSYGPPALVKPAALTLWALTWFGILFMIYLTSLEPFVIGSSCAWCLTTALIMTTLFFDASRPALEALRSGEEDWDDEEEDQDEEAAAASNPR
ncbi:MAG: vitamin K epoxide reductase family protein [Chloroflexota bacterium]